MNIDRAVVTQIARLAHLELKEEETELLARQLHQILQYVEQLNEVEHPAEPFSFTYLPPIIRPDEIVPSLSPEEALQNAPESLKQLFKVPRIIP